MNDEISLQRKIPTIYDSKTACTEDRHVGRDIELTARVADFSPTLCFYYVALFASVRQLLKKFRTTNPMWIKTPKERTARIRPSYANIAYCFQTATASLADLLSSEISETHREGTRIDTGDSRSLPFSSNFFDAAIGSPPYATRLDYVIGTLPELAVLGAKDADITHLRTQMTGSPVVRHQTQPIQTGPESKTAYRLLDGISVHPSKGSRSYYHPWMRNYLNSFEKSLLELKRTVKHNGTICLIVQDSRYKELHVNLQQIAIEIFLNQKTELIHRYDYPAPNPRFQAVKIGTPIHFKNSNTESLLVFRN